MDATYYNDSDDRDELTEPDPLPCPDCGAAADDPCEKGCQCGPCKKRARQRLVIRRHIRPGEPIPNGAPMWRSQHPNGYVCLEWKVSPVLVLRMYEHRYVMGNPLGVVHHKNGIKTDNRPENLEVMALEDHGRHHHEQKYDRDEAARLYVGGWSTRRVAQHLRVSYANVWLRLKQAGVALRDRATPPKLNADQTRVVVARLRGGEIHASIAADFGVHKGTIGNIWRRKGCYAAFWNETEQPKDAA